MQSQVPLNSGGTVTHFSLGLTLLSSQTCLIASSTQPNHDLPLFSLSCYLLVLIPIFSFFLITLFICPCRLLSFSVTRTVSPTCLMLLILRSPIFSFSYLNTCRDFCVVRKCQVIPHFRVCIHLRHSLLLLQLKFSYFYYLYDIC